MGTELLEPWVVEHETVAVRRRPNTTAPIVSLLERGDIFTIVEKISEQGEDWVRLRKGTVIVKEDRDGGQSETVQIKEDGFVLTFHPSFGMLIKKKFKMKVEESKEEGMLTKQEMQAILRKSSNSKDLIIPLEAKTWSHSEFELFVMSGGTVRPKWCSVPDTNEMLNTNMKDHEVEQALAQAAEWIAGADAVLVGSGAGMGVDSGLSTFRGGKAGVWPALELVGLAYEEICDPKWFAKEPELAWAFWDYCHQAYQATKPHRGYDIVREWASKAPLGAFSFTSNIDSHWAASGWSKKRIIEVHGAVAWLQCAKGCCLDVWEAPTDLGLTECPTTHRSEGKLPQCPKCNGVARPCVQMFGGDTKFAKSRRAVQINRYDGWLKKLASRPDADELRVVCLELGCGLTVPTVRRELESVLNKFKNSRLIRVNPENPGVAKELNDVSVSLPLPAGTALSKLEPIILGTRQAEKSMALFIIWDEHGGGVEFKAPAACPCMQVLRLAEAEDNVDIEFGSEGKPQFSMTSRIQQGTSKDLANSEPVPPSFFWDLHKHRQNRPDPSEIEPKADGAAGATEDQPDDEDIATRTAVLKVRNVTFKNGMTSRLAARVKEIIEMLDDMNARFMKPAYQEEVAAKKDRRGVMQMVKEVHLQVLPRFGIKADEGGVWLMQALTGMGMVGRQEIRDKAAISMHVSYMNQANNLPAVLKAEKPPPEEKKPTPPPPPEPLEVTLTQMGEDEPQRLTMSLMTNTTVAQLREQLAEHLGLGPKVVKQVKFLMRSGSAFGTLKETECVKREIFVVNLDRWTPAEEEPPHEVEVKIKHAVAEDDEIQVTVMSTSTIREVKEAIAKQLGQPEVVKIGRLVRKAGAAFSSFEDAEVIGERRTLLFMGMERLKGPPKAAEAAPPAGRPAASSSGAARTSKAQAAKAEAHPAPEAFPGEPPKKHRDKKVAEPEDALPNLTVDEALRLQADLIKGFSDPEFQAKLKELQRTLKKTNERKFNFERAKLFLTVHSVVLPKYGFEGNQKGVFQMMRVFGGEVNQNLDFQRNGGVLEHLLFGGEMPEEPQAAPGPQSAHDQMAVTAYSLNRPDLSVRLTVPSTTTIRVFRKQLIQTLELNEIPAWKLLRKVGEKFQELSEDSCVLPEIHVLDTNTHTREKITMVHEGGPKPAVATAGGAKSSRQAQQPSRQPDELTAGLEEWLIRKIPNSQFLQQWIFNAFKEMTPAEADAWRSIPLRVRWEQTLAQMLSSPFFQRVTRDSDFAKSAFSLPNYKAPMHFALGDPVLKAFLREAPQLLSRWFGDETSFPAHGSTSVPAAASAPAPGPPAEPPAPLSVSLVRLGDEPLVKWSVELTKASLVRELRERVAAACGLDEKAARKLRFAFRARNQFMSAEDNEVVKAAMAVRNVEVWPPPGT